MLILVLAVAAACGDDDDDDGDGGGGGGSTADAVQVLNTNLGGEPQSLDPQRATDVTSITVLENIYSTLLRLDADNNVQADLAKEVPSVDNGGISADGLTYTYKLRDDLMWSDGTPLVAQAFVDGAKHFFEPGSGNYYVDFYRVLSAGGANIAAAEGIEGDELAAMEQAVVDQLEVSAPDDQTVVYKLNKRSPVFTLLTTMWPLYPVRQDIIDANGDAWTEAGTHVANGAFMLDTWNHNESISLVRNDNWHGEAPMLERINMDMIEDSAIAFLATRRASWTW